jgi:hypothetical protein
VQALGESTQDQCGHPADHGDDDDGDRPEQEPDEVGDREQEPEEDGQPRAAQVVVELGADGMLAHGGIIEIRVGRWRR